MTTAGAAVSATQLTSPYVGLSVFTEDDAAIFFGREPERAVLISNLRAARLTLLYAQSGTGKSSLLRAGVASRLNELAQRSFNERGTARNIPVVFSSWRDEPADELIAQVGQQITRFRQAASPAWRAPQRLEEALEQASEAADAALLVILDQFEEYFLYRSREAQDARFADELASCINRGDLRANFLISIREDAYSGLGDLFKSRIDNVYGNYLRLENLTADSARQAIEKPIASYNQAHRERQPVEIEPALVDVVLGQLRSARLALDQTATGRPEGPNGAAPCRDEIAAPYLQLVMERLWETESGLGSRKLRLATLEQLGGAQTIVWSHLDQALSGLPSPEREAAADILHYLVTPSGTKIALTAADLAEYTKRPVSLARALLEHLASAQTRILRPVAPPPGNDGGVRYEISHDLLAPAILDWGRRQKAARLEQEKEAAERRVLLEKRRARNFRALAAGALALLVVAAILFLVLRPRGLVTAAMAAAAVQPDRLTESLLSTQFAATDVPDGTSAFAPQLSDSLTSLTSTSDNTPKASGLMADIGTKFAGAGDIRVNYYVFDNQAYANSYFQSSDPFPDTYRSAGSFSPPGIGDTTKCTRATGPAHLTYQGCQTLSANVVSYSWVIESGRPNGANLESELALDAVRHLRNVAEETPPESLPQPPGSLRAGTLFAKLNSIFPAMLVPEGLGSSPTVRTAQNRAAPGLMDDNDRIEIDFQGSGPDYAIIDFFVFDTAQHAQSWATPGLYPDNPAGKADTQTNLLPFPPSGFSSSLQAQCNTYSQPAVLGDLAQGVSACYFQWGNVVAEGLSKENATPVNREPSAADSNMALTLAWAALLRVDQAIAPR